MSVRLIYEQVQQLTGPEWQQLLALIASSAKPEPASTVASVADLEAQLLEGMNSGSGCDATTKYWRELHARIDERRIASKS